MMESPLYMWSHKHLGISSSEDFGFVKHKSFAPPSDLQSKFKIENLGHWYLLQDSYAMGNILHLLGVGFYPYQVTVLLCSPSHSETYD